MKKLIAHLLLLAPFCAMAQQVDLYKSIALSGKNGGTGLNYIRPGELLYVLNDSTYYRIAPTATGNSLISGGLGAAPSWGKIGLSTHISGTLGFANGGTGLTALGSANQLLRTNAGATAIEWFTPTYISGNQSITLSGDASGTGTTAITTTLATVNSNVGSFTYGSFTVNAKGLITAASSGTTPNTGAGSANQITYYTAANTQTGSANWTRDGTTGEIRNTGTTAVRYAQLVTGYNQPFTFGSGSYPATLTGEIGHASGTGAMYFAGYAQGNFPAYRFQGYIGSTTPTASPMVFETYKSNGGNAEAKLADTEKCFQFFNGTFNTTGNSIITCIGNGNVGIAGVTSPTAKLHLAAGTATASTAPFKFTSGTNLTAAEAGAMEWNGTNLFITQTTGPTRKTIAYTSDLSGYFTSGANTLTQNTTFNGAFDWRMGNSTALDSVEIVAARWLAGTAANRWSIGSDFSRLYYGTTNIALQVNNSTGVTSIVLPDNQTTGFSMAISGGNSAIAIKTTDSDELMTLGAATMPVVAYGTATNNSASAGQIGEYISSTLASGSAASLTTATALNIDTISLTAGDWDVEGNINFSATTATITETVGGINTTSITIPTDGTEVYSGVQATVLTLKDGVTMQRKRISIAATTNVYLVAKCTFSAGTVAAFGSISARRVR